MFSELFLYGLVSTIVFIILLPFYYIVRVFNGKFLYGWKEKLGFFKNPELGDKVIKKNFLIIKLWLQPVRKPVRK